LTLRGVGDRLHRLSRVAARPARVCCAHTTLHRPLTIGLWPVSQAGGQRTNR